MNNLKYRKSDCDSKQLSHLFEESPSKKLRTTLANSSYSNLDFSYYRSTLSNNTMNRPESSVSSFKKPSNNLKQQLSSLQQKLEQAKMQMKLNMSISQKPSSKQISITSTVSSCKSIIFEKNKPPIQEKQQKNDGLRRYTSAWIKPKNLASPSANPYLAAKHSYYYVTEAIRAKNQKNSLAFEHISTSIQILKQLQHPDKQLSSPHKYPPKIRIPKHPSNFKKTLILDLDETLIHCLENIDSEGDLTISFKIQGHPVEISFGIRPYALTFLKKVAKKWEVIIFTASHQDYANAILDQIDPDKVLIHHRLYRQHCSTINDMYVKDLSLINRDLKDMVLVDNAAYSYALQLSNGIPILPFYDGKDYQLSALQSYLDKLLQVEDVRDINRQYFKLHRYTEFDNSQELIDELYLNNQTNLN